jgi:hypothetical protein
MTRPQLSRYYIPARDALVVALATLLALEAAVALGIREPRFQVAFVVVWVSVAARRLSMLREGRLDQPAFEIRTARHLLLWAAGVLPWMLLWSLPDSRSGYLAAAAMPLPSSLRWVGAAMGVGSIVAPAILKRAGRKGLHSSGDTEATVALVLLSANWMIGLLACISMPVAAFLHPRKRAAA